MLCQFGDVPKLDEVQRETDQCPLWVILSDVTAIRGRHKMLCQFGDVPKLDEVQRETDQCPLWVISGPFRAF
jgi:hypothetical protein